MMTSAQVVETSVTSTDNSPSQDYTHPDDQTKLLHVTPGFKPFTEVKFIDRDPYYYTRRVKEAIHIRLYLNNINRESGIEIPEAWMPTIKKHNNRGEPCDSGPPREQITDQQGSKCTNQSHWKTTNIAEHHAW